MERTRAAVPERGVADLARDVGSSRYLPTKAAAAYMTMATSTLITWRREHRGPVPIRLSSNRVVYDIFELDRAMRERASFERQPVATAQAQPTAAAART